MSKQKILQRKLLFTPPNTKKALHDWVQVFLDIDIPDGVVCPDEGSTSPLQAVWTIYEKALKNDDPEFRRVMIYSAREAYKTLLASVIQCMMMVLFGKTVCTLSAIEDQSKKLKHYLWQHLNRPIVRDFLGRDNRRTLTFCRYKHKRNKNNITEKEWLVLLSDDEKNQYEKVWCDNTIIVATKESCNGQHPNFVTADEIDLLTKAAGAAYEEAKMMQAMQNGMYPITLLISTRKSSLGLVQKEIDEAAKSGLMVLHWNILDVTEKCPPERHLPNEPKVTIYRSDESLEAISEDDWDKLSTDQQEKFVKDEVYAGCIKNCRMVAYCKTRLVNQVSKSNLLKKIPVVQGLFREVSIESAQAQLLCWKAAKEGAVYRFLDKNVHMLTAAQMANKVTGDDYPETFTKEQLIALLMSREARFYAGMDWGYTHAFACCVGAKDGNRMFIIESIAVAELEISQKIDICEKRIKRFDPVTYADPEDPSSIKTFRKHGYKMREWKKNKNSVIEGVNSVRMKLKPVAGIPQLFFLKGDEGVELLYTHLSRHRWKLDIAGRPTDELNDDETKDLADCLRYLVMNVFPHKGKPVIAKDEDPIEKHLNSMQKQYHQHDWMSKVIAEHMGTENQENEAIDEVKPKKSNIIWEI